MNLVFLTTTNTCFLCQYGNTLQRYNFFFRTCKYFVKKMLNIRGFVRFLFRQYTHIKYNRAGKRPRDRDLFNLFAEDVLDVGTQ